MFNLEPLVRPRPRQDAVGRLRDTVAGDVRSICSRLAHPRYRETVRMTPDISFVARRAAVGDRRESASTSSITS